SAVERPPGPGETAAPGWPGPSPRVACRSPFPLPAPRASLPGGTEVLPTHTLFLYHHSLLPLPFPLPPLPAGFTSAQLGKIWAPPARAPALGSSRAGDRGQGHSGRGKRQRSRPL
ncbi:hypothetical protein H1C71_017950, partial [Ictidomys tridecemlineatus]